MNTRKLYLLTTFLWSYFFWGIGIYLSYTSNSPILLNEHLIMDLLKGDLEITQNSILISTLILLAGFGPLIGATIVYFKDLRLRKNFFSLFNIRFELKYLIKVLVIITTISVLPVTVIGLITGENIQINSIGLLISFFLILLLLQFFTTSTEEVGWRGYLLPSYLGKNMTMWQANLRVGLIWAIWHFPILIYIFIMQGLPVYGIILSVIGFTVGTIAMSLIHTYFLIKSKSVFLSMIIHTLYNAIPLTLSLVFTRTNYAAIITQIGMWAVVAYIEKQEGKIFDEPVRLN